MLIMKTVLLTVLLVGMTLPALADDALPDMPSGDSSSSIPVDSNQGKTYTVDCFFGKPSEGRNLGSLMVTSLTEAGPACNSTFGDCNNGCYGCLTDGSNICMDRYGSKYQP